MREVIEIDADFNATKIGRVHFSLLQKKEMASVLNCLGKILTILRIKENWVTEEIEIWGINSTFRELTEGEIIPVYVGLIFVETKPEGVEGEDIVYGYSFEFKEIKE